MPAACINHIFMSILGDPGADSGVKEKTKRAEKNGAKKSKEHRSLLFFTPFFSARLVFPLPPLSAPGSPRMIHALHYNKTKGTYLTDEARLLADSACETLEIALGGLFAGRGAS